LSISELIALETIVTAKITFINEGLIPAELFAFAEELLADVDISDSPFVALTKHLQAKLWTNDKELIQGLKKKKFKDIITTEEMFDLYDAFERE